MLKDEAPPPRESPEARAKRVAEDKELVEAAQDGDNRAFGKLVERYQRRVYALAFGILRQREDAWDVAQESFVKAYRNLARFEGESAFYTWLYRIAYNLSIDTLRSKSRREALGRDETRRLDVAADVEGRARPEHPSEAVTRREVAGVVRKAMDQLSEKHRAIIVLREIEGLSYEEMADVLKISKGTVMSRLFHARKNLEVLLRPYVEEGEDRPPDGHLAPQGA